MEMYEGAKAPSYKIRSSDMCGKYALAAFLRLHRRDHSLRLCFSCKAMGQMVK